MLCIDVNVYLVHFRYFRGVREVHHIHTLVRVSLCKHCVLVLIDTSVLFQFSLLAINTNDVFICRAFDWRVAFILAYVHVFACYILQSSPISVIPPKPIGYRSLSAPNNYLRTCLSSVAWCPGWNCTVTSTSLPWMSFEHPFDSFIKVWDFFVSSSPRVSSSQKNHKHAQNVHHAKSIIHVRGGALPTIAHSFWSIDLQTCAIVVVVVFSLTLLDFTGLPLESESVWMFVSTPRRGL